MRIEETVTDWQATWDWCNKHIASDCWDMIYHHPEEATFSVDDSVYSDFFEREK